MTVSTRHARLTLVDAPSALLLRAVSHNGPEAVAAFTEWRSTTTILDANARSRRILPLVGDMIRREGLSDPELDRIVGVSRHVWTQNTLNERLLLNVIDELASAGIVPVLLKGAALFARSRHLMSKRMASDGDILVRPEDLPRAAALLRDLGLDPKGRHWDDFGPPLVTSDISGVGVRRSGVKAEVDLHWRPLFNIRDHHLGDLILADAEQISTLGRQVHVPSLTHHLFLSLARCEPWDADESFARLVEAQLLLAHHGGAVVWPRLLGLVTTYGLEPIALAFLGDLSRACGVAVPADVMSALEVALNADSLKEWKIRAIPPERRSESQRGYLIARDQAAGRDTTQLPPAGPFEIHLRGWGLNVLTARALWSWLRARVPQQSVTDVRFLAGFGAPEREGRWSSGKWAAIAIPLTRAQQAGEPVALKAHPFFGRSGRARIVAFGGGSHFDHIQVRSDAALDLRLTVRPLAELGGGGLILLWLPDAVTPLGEGISSDPRELGLFLHRQWNATLNPPERVGFVSRLRDVYRRLPIPPRLRPALSRTVRGLRHLLAPRRIALPLSSKHIPQGNVILSAYLSDLSGIGRAGRLTRESIASWGVPVVSHDIRLDPSASTILGQGDGGVWICHCNAPEALELFLGASHRFWRHRYRIGIWAYELDHLPADWVRVLRYFHEIWAPSQFVADAITRSMPRRGPLVRVVPHPLPVPPPRERPTPRPDGHFRFLSMFDARSTAARKNPFGAIQAFQLAFTPDNRNVSLVVKVAHSEADLQSREELEAAITGWPNISLLTRHLSDTEALDLIAGADCLVSLHRAEGFGLPIAEAMCVGTPAIVTGWSAPAEFSAGAAIAISYTLVPVVDRSSRYSGFGLKWAEPDIDEAAREMRALSADPQRWQDLSQTGIDLARTRLQQPIPIAPCLRFLTAPLG